LALPIPKVGPACSASGDVQGGGGGGKVNRAGS
jgi:hypothetical protein